VVHGPAEGFFGLKDPPLLRGDETAVQIRPPTLLHLGGIPNRPIILIIHPIAVLAQLLIEESRVFRGSLRRLVVQGEEGQKSQENRKKVPQFHRVAPLIR
jgi:hypothetical protein